MLVLAKGTEIVILESLGGWWECQWCKHQCGDRGMIQPRVLEGLQVHSEL